MAGSSNSPVELSRAERKEQKKAKKQQETVDDEDKDLVNPNHLPVKNLKLSDVGAPRELSRRERCVIHPFMCLANHD